MSFDVTWTPGALKNLKRLDPPVAARVLAAIARFSEEELGDIKKLTGQPGYRLRVGQWRVRFIYNIDRTQIEITSIASRGEAYR